MAEPVTLAEAKEHLRVDDDSQDAAISRAIVAAREWAEGYTGLTLVPVTVLETRDSFGTVRLKHWPITADSVVTISYVDGDGITQSIADYRLLAGARPALLLPAIGQTWPGTYSAQGAVTIEYPAGFEAPEDVPAAIREAILAVVAGLYDNREAGLSIETEKSAARLCARYKRRVL